MDIVRTGSILNTENYEQCVRFYQNVFALRVLFEETSPQFQLTCFELGDGSYLMVETGGSANIPTKSIAQNATKLRLNVRDIHQACEHLKKSDIPFTFQQRDWGDTIDLHDPDGNRISIREEKSFRSQWT
jgi:lactoylglutathione lyase